MVALLCFRLVEVDRLTLLQKDSSRRPRRRFDGRIRARGSTVSSSFRGVIYMNLNS